jgi:hypothetical protein
LISERVPLRRRVPKAAFSLVGNVIVWILLPSFISSYLAASLPSIPLANLSFIYAFGAVITGLQVLGALTEGMAVSVPFVAGSYLVSAYYIWAATDGGMIPVSAAGVSIILSFRPLVFLLMVPSLFNAVKAPVTFLLEGNEVTRPSPDEA